MRLVVLAGSALMLAGCANLVEKRVEDELIAAGIPAPMAGCMAERMAARLSTLQLRKLARLRPEEGEADIPLTVAGYLERVRRVDDPEVLEVSATAAAICAFEGI